MRPFVLSGSLYIKRGTLQHILFFPPGLWLTTTTTPSLRVSGTSDGYPKGTQAPPPESELGMFLTDILPPRCEGYPKGKQALWVNEGFYYFRSSELIAFGC
jgi:hypothetical protein